MRAVRFVQLQTTRDPVHVAPSIVRVTLALLACVRLASNVGIPACDSIVQSSKCVLTDSNGFAAGRPPVGRGICPPTHR